MSYMIAGLFFAFVIWFFIALWNAPTYSYEEHP